MKLHRLELEGFGPFLARQSVDFDAFDSDGLFLISGRTGAGKSSILDGVCYALYGTVPRYDGGDRGLRSDHAGPSDPTEVRLEFTAAGERWRVTRSPEFERPKARGEGTTVQKSSVLIEQFSGGRWEGRATKQREVADILDGIVGLDRDQFQQVILLAQNRFAEFLLAKNDDRQALLRTLFGTRRYEEYEKAFENRRRLARQSLDADLAQLEAHLAHAEGIVVEHGLGPAPGAGSDRERGGGAADGSSDTDATGPQADRSAVPATAPASPTATRLDAIARAVLRAEYRANEAVRRRDIAQAAHDDALAAFGERSALRRKQDERAACREVFAALTARGPGVAADRETLRRARTAEALRAPIEGAERAAASAARATAEERSARAAWIAAGEEDSEVHELRALVEGISGDLALWAQAADVERSLGALEAVADRARGAVAELEGQIEALAEDQDARSARIAELEPAIALAEDAAPSAEAAREALAVAAERLEGGRDAARLAPAAQDAEAVHLAAVTEVERATAAVRTLLQRRLDGYAGELAGGLTDDTPCPVCGAMEHPRPAQPSDEPVTDAAIAEAESAVEVSAAAASAASDRARKARVVHQAAAARAGGETLERLESLHSDAQARVTAAEAAETELAALKAELRVLRDAEAAATAQRAESASRLVIAREERVAATQAVATAHATVAAARGEFDAVADRVRAATRRRDLARALADAADEAGRLAAAAAAAVADRDARLADTDFSDAQEASAALRSSAIQEQLAESIRQHEVALETERTRLFDLETELAGVGDEPVDVAAAADLVRDADRDWKAETAVAAKDGAVASQLADAAERATAVYEASAERTAAFEVIAGLADAVAGRNESRMDLETFVLAAELEEIVDAANLRLATMSSDRYLLAHTDAVTKHRGASGLGLAVFDAYTGQARSPHSLSGGETFLASLALALGLAEVVTSRAGGVRLDTLFIDEGFGSLDDETLELAMRTLDELRQGGRTVGLISHVAAMKEQLPAQLTVTSTPLGPSVISQGAAIGV